MSNTRYMPPVEVGQTWADNDPRSAGRTIKVIAIEGAVAIVETRTVARNVGLHRIGRTSKVRLDRFNPGRQTGYSLVWDA